MLESKRDIGKRRARSRVGAHHPTIHDGPCDEIYAIRYAEPTVAGAHIASRRPHGAPMPMVYFA